MAFTKKDKPTTENYTQVAKPVYGETSALAGYAQAGYALAGTSDDYTKKDKPSDITMTKVLKPTL